MSTRPSDEAPGQGAGPRPPGGPAADRAACSTAGSADPTAALAAAGLGLLALSGWLLNTTRPWHKPSSPITLGLDWTASGTLLICGLVLLTRCIRTVHCADEAPYDPADEPRQKQAGRTGEVPPAQPA
ncbi:hypothetical protein OG389_22315 [Streptomyces sp. NBC_00435]|uniref:hypothetical protein n=1 Tax=Streptomyces sp. NBC_00435 TaxID=2903649 RepID=UPI002E226628